MSVAGDTPTRRARGWREAGGRSVAALGLAIGLLGGTSAGRTEDGAFEYDAKGQRDPFVALVRDGRLVGVELTKATSTMVPVLYGILWDPEGQSIALINDVEAKVGDMVGAYRVEEIREEAVVLLNGGEPVVLTISFELEEADGGLGSKGRDGP